MCKVRLIVSKIFVNFIALLMLNKEMYKMKLCQLAKQFASSVLLCGKINKLLEESELEGFFYYSGDYHTFVKNFTLTDTFLYKRFNFNIL